MTTFNAVTNSKFMSVTDFWSTKVEADSSFVSSLINKQFLLKEIFVPFALVCAAHVHYSAARFKSCDL